MKAALEKDGRPTGGRRTGVRTWMAAVKYYGRRAERYDLFRYSYVLFRRVYCDALWLSVVSRSFVSSGIFG